MEGDLEDVHREKEKQNNHTKGQSAQMWGECMNSLISSILAYGLTDIRQLARKETKSLGDDPDAIARTLNLPISLSELVKIILDNNQLLRKKLGDQSFRIYLDSLELLEKELDRSEARQVQCVVCDDERSDKELVYHISVNPVRHGITLAFRGSVTLFDWLSDADPFITVIPNPLASEPGQSTTIGIHDGFFSKCVAIFWKDSLVNC